MPPAGRYFLLPLKSRDAIEQLAQEFKSALEVELTDRGDVRVPSVNVPSAADLWFAEFKAGKLNPFTWPITGRIGDRRSTGLSATHTGVDFGMPCGAQLVALRDGVVFRAGMATDPFTGNFVMVEYADGVIATFAHLSKVVVKNGQKVNAADWIGNVGKTGAATGCHLHLELHRGRGNLGTTVNLLDPFMYYRELV